MVLLRCLAGRPPEPWAALVGAGNPADFASGVYFPMVSCVLIIHVGAAEEYYFGEGFENVTFSIYSCLICGASTIRTR